jgi:hypothetical protein
VKDSFKMKNCNLNELREKLGECFNNYFLAHPEKNTTDQQQILESENIPEFLITSGQNRIHFSYLALSLLVIHNLIKRVYE